MLSAWAAVDGLMRELGALRNDARALTVDAAIAADLDELIAAAAQAVDDTVSAPEAERVLIAACEAIVEARERIASFKGASARAAKIASRNVDLRRQSARLLYASVTKARG